MRQIDLDFENDPVKAFDTLNDILFSSGRNSLHIAPGMVDEETKLLFSLLRQQGIRILACEYMRKENFTEQTRHDGSFIAHLLGKRGLTLPLLNALHILSEYKYAEGQIVRGALYYPEIKAFLRCGDLTPTKLLEMFGNDGCEYILLFHDAIHIDETLPPDKDVFL